MTQTKQPTEPTEPTEPAPTEGTPQPVRGYFIPGPLLQATLDQLQNSTSPNRTVNEVNRMLNSLANLPPATFVPAELPPPSKPNRAARRKSAAKPTARVRRKKG